MPGARILSAAIKQGDAQLTRRNPERIYLRGACRGLFIWGRIPDNVMIDEVGTLQTADWRRSSCTFLKVVLDPLVAEQVQNDRV
mmetsp:Transcript_12622/g.51112  ORF Transcript_12622/g.51112 Transcript_12622/m.51112 type:complete len:84 (+) Transcript_12622:1101-1352(+)